MTKVVFRIVIIALLLSLAGCLPSDNEAGGLDLCENWTSSYLWWLNKGYVVDYNTTGFGEYPVQLLTEPGLYTTYGSIKLLSELGADIDKPELIASWIASLQLDSGGFDCMLDEAPRLWETYWAVYALRHLDRVDVADVDATYEYVCGLQDEDGAFPFDDLASHDHSRINSTIFALRILDMLGRADGDAFVRGMEFLQQARRELVNSGQPDAGILILVWECLSEMTELDLTGFEKQIIDNMLTELLAMRGDPMVARTVRRLIQICDSTGGSVDQLTIHQYIEREADRLLDGDVVKFSGNVDPDMTYDVVYLARFSQTDVYCPGSIVDTINSYRIDGGWLRFVYTPPAVGSTYYVLASSDILGVAVDVEKDLIGQFLSRQSASADVADVKRLYQAVRGLELLGQLDQVAGAERVEIADTEQDVTPAALHNLAYSGMIQRIMDDDSALCEKFTDRLIRFCEDEQLIRIEFIYYLAIIQSVFDVEIMPAEEWMEYLRGFWRSSGGFGSVSVAAVDIVETIDEQFLHMADVVSTYQAIRVMELLDLNLLSLQEMDALEQFVLECQRDYGFDFVASSSLEVGATLQSTYKALYSLRWIEEERK